MMKRGKERWLLRAVVKMLKIYFLCFYLIGELQRPLEILWSNFILEVECRALGTASGILLVSLVFSLAYHSSSLSVCDDSTQGPATEGCSGVLLGAKYFYLCVLSFSFPPFSGSRCPYWSWDSQLRELRKKDLRYSLVFQSLTATLPCHTDDKGIRLSKSASPHLNFER